MTCPKTETAAEAAVAVVEIRGIEPDPRKPRSSTFSRPCNDHAGLSGAAVPVRPPWSRLFSTCVAATRQRGYTVPCTGKHYDRAHPIRSRRAVRAR